jgi:hypothetical protein
MTDEANAFNE